MNSWVIRTAFSLSCDGRRGKERHTLHRGRRRESRPHYASMTHPSNGNGGVPTSSCSPRERREDRPACQLPASQFCHPRARYGARTCLLPTVSKSKRLSFPLNLSLTCILSRKHQHFRFRPSDQLLSLSRATAFSFASLYCETGLSCSLPRAIPRAIPRRPSSSFLSFLPVLTNSTDALFSSHPPLSTCRRPRRRNGITLPNWSASATRAVVKAA